MWAFACRHGRQRLADMKAMPVDELEAFCNDIREVMGHEAIPDD